MGRRRRSSPLPPRHGVDATRVVLRTTDELLIDALRRAPALSDLDEAGLLARFAAREIVDLSGSPLDPSTPTTPGAPVYLYRDLPVEVAIPFDLPVLHADDDIIVVDKPHFLATMPRGVHVVETALVRLRREFGTDLISPAHRLDRLTAGVLLFTRRPQARRDYQALFADRLVQKEYRAAAPVRTDLRLPADVENRILKDSGDLRARVVDGEVNARSRVELLDASSDATAGLAEYRLTPHTGRTHQLRLHMAGLGIPIDGDPLYPEVRAELAARPDSGDFTRPLRLVAHRLEFDDPLTGRRRVFCSTRSVLSEDEVSEDGV
ncbi:pseudouridine synthase [Williamsia maris]|uniref:RNA pseudouridylate synthase n=1 Tax=Williamsia maris TaxID=72806 RepID=A0ABT1HBX7_9NOCA|nr:pseudouridine synthase [Williamsia maris]MCP2175674.1 tRNA pseudouridine32 synthase / 23S rRNA pseudouridine746 synthase [Williamsia maris]